MKKMVLFLCIIILSACGAHESASVGFTQTGDVTGGVKAGAMKAAMDEGQLQTFMDLIAQGASVDARIDEAKNATLLIYTAMRDLPKFTNFLLENGADTQLTDDDGRTALQVAEQNGRGRIVMLLDPERQQQAQADLLVAIKKKKVPTIEELLNAGANPNFIDEETGETPLTASVLLKKGAHVTKFLVEWKDTQLGITGTDINMPNASGITPLGFAMAHLNQDVIDLLKKYNAKETL